MLLTMFGISRVLLIARMVMLMVIGVLMRLRSLVHLLRNHLCWLRQELVEAIVAIVIREHIGDLVALVVYLKAKLSFQLTDLAWSSVCVKFDSE